MVMQEGGDVPVEAPIEKETKKYVVVKNHIRELPTEKGSSQPVSDEEEIPESSVIINKQERKKRKKSENILHSSESETTEISKSDIEELKTLYKKCKAVIQKIETKYGHLLNINEETAGSHRKRKNSSESFEYEECSCSFNKKIIFDENGQQIIKEVKAESHICPKKLKSKRDTKSGNSFSSHNPHIQMEVDNYEYMEIPDDLVELGEILKDHNIHEVLRRKVIQKIHSLKQDYLYQLRCERQSLIEKLKENPDDILDFNSTNLSTLPGYPLKPINDNKKD